jgi:hypothetical protein
VSWTETGMGIQLDKVRAQQRDMRTHNPHRALPEEM